MMVKDEQPFTLLRVPHAQSDREYDVSRECRARTEFTPVPLTTQPLVFLLGAFVGVFLTPRAGSPRAGEVSTLFSSRAGLPSHSSTVAFSGSATATG